MGEAGAKVVSSSAIEKRRSERKCPPLPKAAPWLVFPYQVKEKIMLIIVVFCHPEDKRWKTKWVNGSSLCCFKNKLYLMGGLYDDYLEIDKGKLWDNDDYSLLLCPLEMTRTLILGEERRTIFFAEIFMWNLLMNSSRFT